MTRLLITTGDVDGIGLEVTRKAINSSRLPARSQLIVVAKDGSRARKEWARIHSFRVLDVESWPLLTTNTLPGDKILVLPSRLPEALWFDHAVDLASQGHVDGIVTGPLSKESFFDAGLDAMGHTGLLAQKTRCPVFQGYRGDDLNVVLVTDHIAVSKVEQALTQKKVVKAIAAAEELRASLPRQKRRLPIAVLGLNPHAGEDGRIGSFESRLQRWLPRQVIGPLPPDTAFTEKARSQYSVVIALYHDQGLIPFKMLHGQDSGFQLSLGIPFVRTSVDHGTAVDIAGKNVANPGSMAAAIAGAFELLKSRK
ncbi:MAG: 4-hydroxythreonine-4-phosphate dehydrogenase PdxA [Bdellovibrionaceae bacterium]|nr:4-hydroxythreonine-4-phosphate dehydrogenase PdxA [Pseudobdellovibrionaceae bacterium]